MALISRLQRLTTSTSVFAGYSPSVGLDDCLLPAAVRAAARAAFAARIAAAVPMLLYAANAGRPRLPYEVTPPPGLPRNHHVATALTRKSPARAGIWCVPSCTGGRPSSSRTAACSWGCEPSPRGW